MSSLIFNQAKLDVVTNVLQLNTHNFYAALVTAIPAGNLLTQSQLTQPTGGNYTVKDLANRSLLLESGVVKLRFDNPIWDLLTVAGGASVVGMAIIRKVGGTASGTDPLLAYLHFSAAYTPNGSTFQVSASDRVYLNIT